LTAKNSESDNSSEEKPQDFLNGDFDATTMHLFNHEDDPSSSEEQTDNENV